MSIVEHQLVCEVLRKKITRIKKRKERVALQEVIDDIREKSTVINKFYNDYPYCDICGGRRLRGHTHDGNQQSKKASM